MNPLQRIRDLHTESGPLAWDFQGNADQIHSVAAELGMTEYVEVTVDDDVCPGRRTCTPRLDAARTARLVNAPVEFERTIQ